MPLTLFKYFLRRWLQPLVGGVLFFGGLLVANDLVRVSRDIFSQGAPIRWLFPIVLPTLPETFAMVLPMAAILGGLIGTQQLSEGSEMVASQGLGVGIRSLLKPWAALSGILVVLASVNAHLLVPRVSSTVQALQDQMVEETKTRFLRPGAPPYFPPANPTMGVWVAPGGQVHILEVTPTSVQHLVAKSLDWQRDERSIDKPGVMLNLNDLKGVRYEKAGAKPGIWGQASQSLRIPLPGRTQILPATPVRYYSTPQLLAERSSDAWIEFSRRVTFPLSAAALLLLGIALGIEHPRFRKGGALIRSLGAILAYYMVMKFLEGSFASGGTSPAILFLPPFLFLGTGFAILFLKMRPHRTRRFSLSGVMHWVESLLRTLISKLFNTIEEIPLPHELVTSKRNHSPGILRRWSRRLWWRNWGAVMGTLLTLDLMMEFVALAEDLSHAQRPVTMFIRYWIWNLPTFLAIAFPVAFLLGGVMAFSEAAISREWVALKAGGTSLLQWIGSSARAWMSILLLTFVVQALVAPWVVGRADALYRQILNRPQQTYQTKPWMNLNSTGILWFLDGRVRYGFPLAPPGEAPILLRWHQGANRADALPWDGLYFYPGPATAELFPSTALQRSSSAEETSTLDLFNWQKWAPDAERATMLWSRLLSWLAGPCLLFAMLAHSFPPPRGGRGQVLGTGLVVGLVFLGLQAIFGGAARSGEIPALWGVAAPLLILLGIGFSQLHRLRT